MDKMYQSDLNLPLNTQWPPLMFKPTSKCGQYEPLLPLSETGIVFKLALSTEEIRLPVSFTFGRDRAGPNGRVQTEGKNTFMPRGPRVLQLFSGSTQRRLKSCYTSPLNQPGLIRLFQKNKKRGKEKKKNNTFAIWGRILDGGREADWTPGGADSKIAGGAKCGSLALPGLQPGHRPRRG